MAVLNTHEQFLRQAITLASQARREGNYLFGALLVLDGRVVLTAKNSVATDRDPTGHAETNPVARAIRQLAPDRLRRAVLYISCEPRAMCVGKMYWAGVRFVVYALSAEELAMLAGPDFLVPCRELFARATETVTVLGLCWLTRRELSMWVSGTRQQHKPRLRLTWRPRSSRKMQ